MCRLLGYLGPPIQLDRLLYKPEHSLIVQSYQPQQMNSAVLNADGFGIGWYHPYRQIPPYTYKNTLPIWGDLNLPQLSRYIESQCVLGYVRSATVGQGVDMSNCQPFVDENLMFIHNGYIANFRASLYRQIRNSLDDYTYQLINGTTDSEHLFALLVNHLRANGDPLETALASVLTKLTHIAAASNDKFLANMLISNGKRLIASRYAFNSPPPSLYWLRDDPLYPNAVLIASEPLFEGNWNSCPEQSLISVGEDLEVCINAVSEKRNFSGITNMPC